MQDDDDPGPVNAPCVVCFGETAARAARAEGLTCVAPGDQSAARAFAAAGGTAGLVEFAPDGRDPEFTGRAERYYLEAASIASRTVQSLSGEPDGFDNTMLKPLLFRAAREAAALEMALEAATEPAFCAGSIGARAFELRSGTDPVLQAAALMLGWRWQAVEPPLAVPPFLVKQAEFAGETKLSGGLTLVDLHGIPDPVGRLKLIAGRTPGTLVVIYHRQHAGPAAVIEAAVAAMSNTQILTFDMKGKEHTATDAADLSEFVAGCLTKQIAQAARFAEALEQLTGIGNPLEIHVSDHVSPASQSLLRLARQRSVELHVYSHGAWPLPEPFQLNVEIPDDVPPTRYAWLQCGTPGINAVSPPWRFNTGLRSRLRRQLLKVHGLTRRPLREKAVVGVLLTSGQDFIAADTDARLLREGMGVLARICEKRGYSLRIRLRETSDDPGYLRGIVDQALAKVGVSSATSPRFDLHNVGDISMDRYLSDLDMVVEAGHPTSAILEAIQMGVPVYKWRAAEDLFASREIQPFGPDLLEDLSPEDLDDETAFSTGGLSKSNRRKTALRQLKWFGSRFRMR
ncbi:MAG: hypothetical protein ABJN75_02055 [Hoeflea sp.]|uniref:hypothetical protein n=1 Tax=Hoeflea sp. TaxID=1940281 RepID=UPI0032973C1F